MPQRSKIYTLPEALVSELNARLAGSGFGAYAELSEWLAEHGHAISASSIRRYGSKVQTAIERIQKATETAKALTDSVGDPTELADASLRLIQERMFDVVMHSDDQNLPELSRAARALAEAALASVNIHDARRTAIREAAEKIAKVARHQGVSRECEEMLQLAIDTVEPGAAEGAKVLSRRGISKDTAAQLRAVLTGSD